VELRDFLKYGEEVAAGVKQERINRLVNLNPDSDQRRWMELNKDWLMDWYKNAEPVADPEPRVLVRPPMHIKSPDTGMAVGIKPSVIKAYQMQIFTKHVSGVVMATVANVDSVLDRTKYEMSLEMLYSFIWGVRSKQPEFEETDEFFRARTMDGFIAQKGRYPTPQDRVRIFYLEGNGITRWFTVHKPSPGDDVYRIVSECCIVAD